MQIYKNTVNYAIIYAESVDKVWTGMRHYFNSTRGRAQLEAECPADIVQAVEAVWGTTPTVTEPTAPTAPVSTAPTLEDRVSALEAAQLAALGV